MPNLIDLSIPVRHGDGRLGLEVAFSTPYSFETCGWQGSSFSMFAHYATHVDAPNHFIEGAYGIDQAPIGKLMGAAALIPLDDHGAEKGIAADTLEDRGRHVRRGDIVILRTGWSDRHWGQAAFWTDGPYLDTSAADWLVERGAKAVVYDFSEEFAVRQPGFRGEDCPIHHRILGAEIYNIEYVHNLGRISAPRCAILALPLKLAGLDGAPARVVAIEGMDFPAEFTVTA
jgi:arylformamidase